MPRESPDVAVVLNQNPMWFLSADDVLIGAEDVPTPW
jgi:hypothetical protein